MKLTVGPLPAAVYWKRRALVAMPVLAVLVVGYLAVGPNGNDDTVTAGDVKSSTAGAGAAGGPSPSNPVDVAGSSGASRSPSAAAAGSPSTSATAAPSTSATPSGSPTESAPAAPSNSAEPARCSDKDLDVTAYLTDSNWTVGSEPKLRMAVTNTSDAACVRDLGPSNQHFQISDKAGNLIWSSDFCEPSTGHKDYTLKPDGNQIFSITWAGTSAAARCAAPRKQVKPGHYTLSTKLGKVQSKAQDFTMRPDGGDADGSSESPQSSQGPSDTGGVDPATI